MLLAACPDASIRNGVEAVVFAEQARSLGDGDPIVLDTLAAAYAEAGRFADAVQAARRALSLATSQDNAALANVLSGRLDTNTAPELDAALKENLEGVTGLVIDLAEVQYVSSAGLRVLLAAQKEMNKISGTLKVLHPNEYVMDVFEATGFVDIMDIEQ